MTANSETVQGMTHADQVERCEECGSIGASHADGCLLGLIKAYGDVRNHTGGLAGGRYAHFVGKFNDEAAELFDRIKSALRERTAVRGDEGQADSDGAAQVAAFEALLTARGIELDASAKRHANRIRAGQRAARLRTPRRCEANARKGTGIGMCDEPLDAHGQCEQSRNHR